MGHVKMKILYFYSKDPYNPRRVVGTGSIGTTDVPIVHVQI